ncbi:DUF1572 family protein [Maribacter halichondriae]|uniref:DUF1572 family protein n=1 Tax=Maribacter halichondriae TaxID=2980554 RepID=UPI002359FB98|nr:DUF1572 family protein [Maribacter sp. Hal144]
MDYQENFLESVRFELMKYKSYGEKTFAQLSEEDIHRKLSEADNSIAIIVKHMVGNMLSRFTNFLTEDGEKPWRHRDVEFEDPYENMDTMMAAWQMGWDCLFVAMDSINKNNFDTHIKIRNEDHTVIEALTRQLAHYASHIGQIMLMGKMIKGSEWKSLSIPKGASEAFNKEKFEN